MFPCRIVLSCAGIDRSDCVFYCSYYVKKITTRHSHKLQRLLDIKVASEKLETNSNEAIVNLSRKLLSTEQIDILKLGLRHDLATRPNSSEMIINVAVSEDIYDQLERKQIWKEGFFTKEGVKNTLRSFTYNYLDLDLKQYFTDRKKIRIFSALSKRFCYS